MFSDVSVDIPAGQVVALIGAPGSGKSTMAMLASWRMEPPRLGRSASTARTCARCPGNRWMAWLATSPSGRPGRPARCAAPSCWAGRESTTRTYGARCAWPVRSRTSIGRGSASTLLYPLRTDEWARIAASAGALAAALAGRPRLLVLDHSVDSLYESDRAAAHPRLRRSDRAGRDDTSHPGGRGLTRCAVPRPTGCTHLDRHQSLLRNSRPYDSPSSRPTRRRPEKRFSRWRTPGPAWWSTRSRFRSASSTRSMGHAPTSKARANRKECRMSTTLDVDPDKVRLPSAPSPR